MMFIVKGLRPGWASAQHPRKPTLINLRAGERGRNTSARDKKACAGRLRRARRKSPGAHKQAAPCWDSCLSPAPHPS